MGLSSVFSIECELNCWLHGAAANSDDCCDSGGRQEAAMNMHGHQGALSGGPGAAAPAGMAHCHGVRSEFAASNMGNVTSAMNALPTGHRVSHDTSCGNYECTPLLSAASSIKSNFSSVFDSNLLATSSFVLEPYPVLSSTLNFRNLSLAAPVSQRSIALRV
jgi:hypothetical protein